MIIDIRRMLLALLTVLFVFFGLTACGAQPRARSTPSSPVGTTGIASGPVTIAAYMNSVPERPWWQGWAPVRPPRRPVIKHIVISGDVLFPTGSAVLSAGAQTQLVGALRLAEVRSARIIIDGYTDNVPIDIVGGNVALSIRRATALARWLEDQGVPARRITVHGYGANNPVAPNSTPQGRAQNRRVEITVTIR